MTPTAVPQLRESVARIGSIVSERRRRTRAATLSYISGFDHRTRWFAAGRTILGLGPLLTLLATPMAAFVVPVGTESGVRCGGVRSASVLCLGPDEIGLEPRRWLLIAIYAAVVAGVLPRLVGPLHLWAAYSLSVSFTLPDGGESIGVIVAAILLPLTLVDGRRNHWHRPDRPLNGHQAAVAAATEFLLRVQLAYVYLDAGISKMGVTDWANGTAEYYIAHDRSFGVAGPIRPFWLWIVSMPAGTLAVTWLAIGAEITIGVLLLGSRRWRTTCLAMDVALHVGIILTIGLWSFSLVMLGSAMMAANPTAGSRHPARPGSATASPPEQHAST